MKKLKFYFVFFIAFLLTQCWLFKDTEGFKEAQKFLENNTVVTEKLGKITKYGNPWGNYKLENDSGTANFDLTITGEKGSADVQIALEKSNSAWNVTSAFLKPESGEEIDLTKVSATFSFFNSYFSDQEWGAPKKPATFKTGAPLYYHGQARGMKVDENNMVYAQVDVELTFPDGKKEIQTEVLKGPSESENGTLDVYYTFTISEFLTVNDKPYGLKMILWDLQTKEKIEVAGEFIVSL